MSIGHHQLDTVDLVNVGCAGVVVYGYDVGSREPLAYGLHHALARHVVRQTCEGLETCDVGSAGFDEVDHLAGEQPAFTALISGGCNG